MIKNTYKFELPPIPYSYEALSPFINAETVHLHYDKHFATYIEKLNKILGKYPAAQSWTLFKLVKNYCQLPYEFQTPVRNNAGGVYNHYLYFQTMIPGEGETPIGNLKQKIDSIFGSYENFKEEFKKTALETFASGYAELTTNLRGDLEILSIPNQDTPLPCDKYPILLIDVWEHAYYLQYQNRRDEYIDKWFHLINWEIVEKNYLDIIT